MSEVLDRAADAMTMAPRAHQGRMMGALTNGFGLAMMRVCAALMVILVGVLGWTGNYLLSSINEHVKDMKDDIGEVRADMKDVHQLSRSQAVVTNELRVEVAAIKQKQADMEMIQRMRK